MTTQSLPSLKLLVLTQVFLTLLFSAGGYLLGGQYLAASIGLGGGVMVLNLGVVAWVWRGNFDKKSIAWTSLVIVIKYAVLLASMMLLLQTEWFLPLGAGLGVASFALTALIFALLYYKKEKFDVG